MARQTQININVESKSAVTSIEKLKEAFKSLKTERDKLAPNGKIKLEFDTGGLSGAVLKELSDSISRLSKTVVENGKVSKGATDNVNSLGNSYSRIGDNVKKTDESLKYSATTFASLKHTVKGATLSTAEYAMSLMALYGILRRGANEYSSFTNSMFNVGISARMSLAEIDGLSSSFFKLSSTVPATAREMAEATDNLIRTGRTYADAMKIIEQTAILSTASGDSLKDTAEVVTKVMVSLGVSGDRVQETLTTMHSTAIQTASDMKYLAEAFKNVAGTASVLVKTSGLAGEELNNYKQRVLDVSMASIGSMANLGISASSAGTKIKQMFGRLTSAEKVARSLFNSAMKLNNIKFDISTGKLGEGNLFQFEDLAELTKKDLPKALEIMSQLYLQGKLTTEVMQKMFTARHFMEISNLLLDINGNIDGFVSGIARGVNYLQDFKKKMFDINSQTKLFANNMMNATEGAFAFMRKGATGFLMDWNDQSKETIDTTTVWGKLVKDLGTDIANIGIILFSTALSVGAVMKGLVPLLTGVFNPIGALITGTVALALARKNAVYEEKKSLLDFQLILSQTTLLQKQNELSVNSTANRYKIMLDTLDTFARNHQSVSSSVFDMAYNIDSSSSVFGVMLDKSSELKSVLSAFEDFKPITKDSFDVKYLEDSLKVVESYKEKVSKTRKELSDDISSIVSASSSDLQDIFDGLDSSASFAEKFDIQSEIERTKGFAKGYIDLVLQGLDDEADKTKKILELRDRYGISEATSKRIIGEISEDTKGLLQTQKDLNSEASKLAEFAEDAKKAYEDLNDQISKNETAINRLMAKTASTTYRLFEATGKIDIGGNILSSLDAVEGIVRENANTSVEADIKRTKSIVGVLEQEVAIGEIRKNNGQLDEKGVKAYEDKVKSLEKERRSLSLLEEKDKLRLSLQHNQLNSLKKELPFYKDTAENRRLAYDYEVIRTELLTAEDPLARKLLESDLARTKALIKHNSEQEKLNANKTTHQIKYTNYLKANFDLELELLKIGASKAKQDQLSYEYKLKQLKAEKSLMTGEYSDLQVSKQTLVGKGFDISKISTAEEGQQFLKDFYRQNVGALTGESGATEKAMYENVRKYVEALRKVEDISEKERIAAVQRYSDVLGDAYSQWQDIYGIMDSASDLGIVSGNYKALMRESKSQYIDDEIGKLNNDFANKNSVEGGETAKIVFNRENISDMLMSEKAKLDELTKSTNESDLKGVKALSDQDNLVKGLIALQKLLNEEKKNELDTQLELLDSYNKLGSVMSKLGSLTGMGGLEDIGGILGSYGDVLKLQADPSKSFDFGKLLDFDSEDFAKNFANAMESAMSQMDMGGSIGAMVGSITGGGQSSQSAGALAGLGTGLLGMTGGAGMAVQLGASLIGGLFDKGDNGQAEADKRSAEQKKIYDKNTEALQKLANNMSNLGSGIDGLNSSLISSFSKLPTFGNLTNVTDTLGKMYSTMEATRKFESVAYQYTKTKKGKSGFLGIGAKASTSEIKTVEFSVQEMLDKYGFKGKIEDMTTDQMRSFSTWLNNLDMGESDNFSVLGEAIEEYAEALDQFDKNIEKFFYDTTMESFAGISSMQQDELRQQIEDFYKNLGFQIDDAMRETIDQMAESMSVMVTIMGDVRSGFIDTWRDSGKNAGDAFLSSMTPYIDAMLENMSQVFYDVYFSDVTSALDKEFKAMSEALVELKKQGADLDFNNLAGALAGSFANVIANIKLAQSETANFNDILLVLQKEAFEAGLTLSEMMELGLVTGTQKSVFDSFKEALTSSDSESAFSAIGDMVGEKVGNALADKMLDNMLSDRILEFSANLDKIVSGSADMTFESLALLAQESMSTSLMLETEQRRLSAIKDMFDMNKDITYQSQDSNISYQTGTSQSVVNNFYLSSNIEAGNVIEADDIERLTDAQMDIIIQKLEDRGIYIG